MHGNIAASSSNEVVQSWTINTTFVRVEFMRCRTNGTVKWSVVRPEVSMLWVRNAAGKAQVTMADGQIHRTRSGTSNR